MGESIWKKEISFRRKPKEIPAAEEGAGQTVVEPNTVEAPAEEDASLPPGDYGWLTTDFDPAAIPEDMPAIAAPAPDEPVEDWEFEKTPFWKKEISFSREAKAPKAPSERKARKARKDKAPGSEGTAETPFWKRELTLSKRPK